ncbi:hypothetical protein OB13_00805 [Pontibacter sp. HJ8]
MKPEDVDKLFRERLGPSSPTPPADLWNRLQDRMEAGMPAKEEEKKPRGFMWMTYSIAAAISLLLAVGIVFYNVQRGTVAVDGMAQNKKQVPEQPLIIEEPAADQPVVAQATEPLAIPEQAEVQKTPETPAPAPAKADAIPRATLAKAEKKPAPVRQGTPTAAPKAAGTNSAPQLIAKAEQPAIPAKVEKDAYINTGEVAPATLASAGSVNMNAQPVEIIIKRTSAVQPTEAEEELTGFEKKQKLAKNIFKQARNLSNGERVELSELGINADKIALETQIGKQKISKVIQL